MTKWINVEKSPQGGIEIQVVTFHKSTGHAYVSDYARISSEKVPDLIKKISATAELEK